MPKSGESHGSVFTRLGRGDRSPYWRNIFISNWKKNSRKERESQRGRGSARPSASRSAVAAAQRRGGPVLPAGPMVGDGLRHGGLWAVSQAPRKPPEWGRGETCTARGRRVAGSEALAGKTRPAGRAKYHRAWALAGTTRRRILLRISDLSHRTGLSLEFLLPACPENPPGSLQWFQGGDIHGCLAELHEIFGRTTLNMGLRNSNRWNSRECVLNKKLRITWGNEPS